jgi:lycopene cyclase domain-containing protein
MTYLGVLALGLVLPVTALSLLTLLAARRRPAWFKSRAGKAAAAALLAHIALAVAYTTPWDNYLVATRVWWYDPARTMGVTLGWVPLEEYLFFVLQTFLAGLLLFSLMRRWPPLPSRRAARPRSAAAVATAAVWLAALLVLGLGWKPGTYLGLELAWALPPIGLQLAVGADTLWRYRRSVLSTLASVTLYVCAVDYLAIGAGVWTIDPAQSLRVLAGGVLPAEEIVFFLLTNTLIVFGLTLVVAPETGERWAQLKASFRRRALLQDRA